MRIGAGLMAAATGVALLTGPVEAGAESRDRAAACELVAETRVSGLEHPWSIAFLPHGRALITERPGRLRLVDPETGWSTVLAGTPAVAAGGQGGLLDVALHPGFEDNRLVYLSYSAAYGGGRGTAVARGRLVLDPQPPHLADVQTIFRIGRPSSTGRHFGSRLAFDPDGHLFVTVGDRGASDRAQDPTDHAGSVLRLRDDGAPPADNPFARGGGAAEIWSLGHRNPQGMAWDRQRGRVWTVEHGARGGDEINLPEAGRNYGWPRISYGRHYSGLPIGEGSEAPGLEQPVHYWDPSIAPSGLAVVTGPLFPAWRGDLLVGALKAQMLVHLTVRNDRVVGEERLFHRAFGRIRDMRIGPDGAIWLLTDEPRGALVRIVPASGTCG